MRVRGIGREESQMKPTLYDGVINTRDCVVCVALVTVNGSTSQPPSPVMQRVESVHLELDAAVPGARDLAEFIVEQL